MARTVEAPDERRSQLIAAAQELLRAKGYERTSVSDIVTAVGWAQGTFEYSFDSKTAIERLLGAPAGSMPIVDEEGTMAWTAD